MVVPRAQVFRLLVKGNKDSGNEIVIGLYRYVPQNRKPLTQMLFGIVM